LGTTAGSKGAAAQEDKPNKGSQFTKRQQLQRTLDNSRTESKALGYNDSDSCQVAGTPGTTAAR